MPPEQIATPTPGGDGGGVPAATPAGAAPAASTEYELDGQKLSADQIREALKASKDYASLTPEFTRRSQVLSRLQKEGVIDEKGNLIPKPASTTSPTAQNPQAQEAVRILKELGFITKEEAEEIRKEFKGFQETQLSQTAQVQLSSVVKLLSEKYTGKSGEPPFKLDEIQAAAEKDPSILQYVQEPNGDYLVDLDATYKRVHATFWDKLPQFHSKALKTERGTQVQSQPGAKDKKPETEEERRDAATEFFRNAKDAADE